LLKAKYYRADHNNFGAGPTNMTTVHQRHTGQTDRQHTMALPAPLLLHGIGNNGS